VIKLSKVFGLSDMHLGHRNIQKYREIFTSIEEHDAVLIENYMKTIRKRDTVYFFGDICFTKDSLELIKKLPGDKHIILGNHDNQYKEFDATDLAETFQKVYGLHSWKRTWLSHSPIHPEELRGKFNMHGHVHDKTLDDYRYANLSMENINYTPVELKVVLETMQRGEIFRGRNG